VLNTLAAFVRAIAGNKSWPNQRWEYRQFTNGVDLQFESDLRPLSARLFRAYAPTHDFRGSKWTSEEAQLAGNRFTARFESAKEGYAAIFGEVAYDLDGKPFTLSTQIRLVPSAPVESK
jgi:hypothetical protein